MSVQARIELERRIVKQVLKSAIAQGYEVSAYYDLGCSEEAVSKTTDTAKLMSELFATDEQAIVLHKPNQTAPTIGWVQFVYGNDGYDVIHDHSANENTETVLQAALALADKYA